MVRGAGHCGLHGRPKTSPRPRSPRAAGAGCAGSATDSLPSEPSLEFTSGRANGLGAPRGHTQMKMGGCHSRGACGRAGYSRRKKGDFPNHTRVSGLGNGPECALSTALEGHVHQQLRAERGGGRAWARPPGLSLPRSLLPGASLTWGHFCFETMNVFCFSFVSVCLFVCFKSTLSLKAA